MNTIDGYKEMLEHYEPSEELKMEVRRGDVLTTIELTLAKRRRGNSNGYQPGGAAVNSQG